MKTLLFCIISLFAFRSSLGHASNIYQKFIQNLSKSSIQYLIFKPKIESYEKFFEAQVFKKLEIKEMNPVYKVLYIYTYGTKELAQRLERKEKWQEIGTIQIQRFFDESILKTLSSVKGFSSLSSIRKTLSEVANSQKLRYFELTTLYNWFTIFHRPRKNEQFLREGFVSDFHINLIRLTSSNQNDVMLSISHIEEENLLFKIDNLKAHYSWMKKHKPKALLGTIVWTSLSLLILQEKMGLKDIFSLFKKFPLSVKYSFFKSLSHLGNRKLSKELKKLNFYNEKTGKNVGFRTFSERFAKSEKKLIEKILSLSIDVFIDLDFSTCLPFLRPIK